MNALNTLPRHAQRCLDDAAHWLRRYLTTGEPVALVKLGERLHAAGASVRSTSSVLVANGHGTKRGAVEWVDACVNAAHELVSNHA